jgi:hypothetical protein
MLLSGEHRVLMLRNWFREEHPATTCSRPNCVVVVFLAYFQRVEQRALLHAFLYYSHRSRKRSSNSYCSLIPELRQLCACRSEKKT